MDKKQIQHIQDIFPRSVNLFRSRESALHSSRYDDPVCRHISVMKSDYRWLFAPILQLYFMR